MKAKSQMTYRIESILEYLPLSFCLKVQPVSYHDFADFGTNSTNQRVVEVSGVVEKAPLVADSLNLRGRDGRTQRKTCSKSFR